MSDLDQKEQDHVRAALRYLHRRTGTWAAVGDAVRSSPGALRAVMSGSNPVSASTALRVARAVGVMVDDLLVGKFLPPGTCPNCGHVITSDFRDENTISEDAPRTGTGLAIVK